MFFLPIFKISKSYIMYFYFDINDSLSKLIIDREEIYSDHDARYQRDFQTLCSHDVSLCLNKIINYCLFNLPRINGFIENMVINSLQIILYYHVLILIFVENIIQTIKRINIIYYIYTGSNFV